MIPPFLLVSEENRPVPLGHVDDWCRAGKGNGIVAAGRYILTPYMRLTLDLGARISHIRGKISRRHPWVS